MYFYELALLRSPLNPLTFQSMEKIESGRAVEVGLKNRVKLISAVVLKEVEKPDFKCSDIVNITDYKYSSMMLETAKFILSYYVCSYGEALSVYTPFEIGLEECEHSDIEILSDIKLSSFQSSALDFIKDNRLALLFADTGSGKTEIYIKAMQEHLKQNEQALLLMPEISLTPQMNKRLQSVFGTSIAIWHSKVTKTRKKKIIEGLQKGEIRVIAGARSALFLPFSNLGIIVVDEEHDDSYKSDSKPRLNAKDIALYMGRKQGIQVVLGSATPSTASFNKVPSFRLKETYFDTQKEIIFNEETKSVNDEILDKIAQKIYKGEQVIVFLPTRANFKYQICDECGKAVECPYCSVSMSLHKNALALKCHYCGYMERIPSSCPACKTGNIKNFRVGTAEVQNLLQERFKDKTIERFDRDAVSTEKKLKVILDDFNEKRIDILVGTQMLSKGHDYHNVKLVVILGIDSLLNMESYKAREKALALLKQTAGRSGRKGFGEVVVQTANREFFEHYLLNADYEEFLKDELGFREELYPPFVRLARVVFAHKNAIKAQNEMNHYAGIFNDNDKIELIGSGESKIFKIANRYRYELMIRSKNVNELLKALHSIKSDFALIDMDTLY